MDDLDLNIGLSKLLIERSNRLLDLLQLVLTKRRVPLCEVECAMELLV